MVDTHTERLETVPLPLISAFSINARLAVSAFVSRLDCFNTFTSGA